MDKWSAPQAMRMRLGGNEACRVFFEAHPLYRSDEPIAVKYEMEYATFYREKLSAECDGKPWTMPEIGSRPRVPKNTVQETTYPNISRNISQSAKTQEFLNRKGLDNDQRSDTIPPNQGGKFTGFGNPNFSNTPAVDNSLPANLLEDPLLILAKGWGIFSSYAQTGVKIAVASAETLGKTVNEQVIQPTSMAVRDPNFNNNMQQYYTTFSEKVTTASKHGFDIASQVGTQGYSMASDLVSKANGYAPMNSPELDELILKERDSKDQMLTWTPTNSEAIIFAPENPVVAAVVEFSETKVAVNSTNELQSNLEHRNESPSSDWEDF